MSAETAEAIRIAQQRCLSSTSTAVVARLELALDALARHPDAVGDPMVLLDNALANARNKLRRRAAIVDITYSNTAVEFADSLGKSSIFAVSSDALAGVGDVVDVLSRSMLAVEARTLLLLALTDIDAKESGAYLGISAQQARERLARARRQARGIDGLRADLLVAA